MKKGDKIHLVVSSRNREWILDRWLWSLEEQEVKIDRITVVDNSSPSEYKQTEWLEERRKEGRLDYVSFPSKDEEGWKRGEYTKKGFVDFTNKCFEVFREGDGDWYFMFDTDQMMEKDGTRKLLEVGKEIVAPIIRTSKSDGIYNFITLEKVPREGIWYSRANNPRVIGNLPFRVDFASGAVLIRREIMMEVKCEDGHPHWEWGAVWDKVREMGKEGVWMVPSITTEHWMGGTMEVPPLVWEGKT